MSPRIRTTLSAGLVAAAAVTLTACDPANPVDTVAAP